MRLKLKIANSMSVELITRSCMKTHWKRSEESVKIEFNKSVLNLRSTKIRSAVGREPHLLTDNKSNNMCNNLHKSNRCMGNLVV